MAIQLDKEYKGIIANYWRINELQFNDLTDTATVTLGLYVNQEASTGRLKDNLLYSEIVRLTNISSILIDQDLSGISVRNAIKMLLYMKIMAPIMQQYEISPVEYDEEGNVTKEAVVGEKNINKWTDGKSV